MSEKKISEKTSKKFSHMLRHSPKTYNVTVDSEGWASVSSVARGLGITESLLKEIVETDSKGRYQIDFKSGKIRAVQGHSIPIKMTFEILDPPEILFHGTSESFLSSIFERGIKSMSRNYVHLSEDLETASVVAKRRKSPIILKIKAKKIQEAGFVFKKSVNEVWLVESVPKDFLVTGELIEVC